jgi:hypothetical protein
MSSKDSGAGQVANTGFAPVVRESESPRLKSQGILDAMADARTLVVNARPRYGSALWMAQDSGSRAVVACLDGDVDLAGFHATGAAHAAFKAVRALRG